MLVKASREIETERFFNFLESSRFFDVVTSEETVRLLVLKESRASFVEGLKNALMKSG